MIDRRAHVEELIEAAQLFRRKTFGMSPLKGSTITPSQWLVVSYIFHQSGASTNAVAKALHMTGSAVTQLVNGLVAKGFLKRENDPHRRAHRLVLSTTSRARLQKFKQKRVSLMLNMFKTFTDKEFEQYVGLNKKMLASLSK